MNEVIALRDKLRAKAISIRHTLRYKYNNKFSRSNERLHRELTTIIDIGRELNKIIYKN